jgi:hypothetical protein
MATPFGSPIQDEPEHHDDPQQQLDAEVADLDPNDPRLTSEALDVNPEGDAYARQPLPPDAKYRAKLKLLKVKDATGAEHDFLPKMHKKSGTAYAFTSIVATIEDASGKYDGVPVYDSWVGTFMNKDKSHKVGTIIRLLKDPAGQPWVKPGERLNHKQWMERFVKVLAGEPEVGIETQWEWSCQACGKAAKDKNEAYPKSITGMHRFPPLRGGGFDPEMRCAVNPAHGFSRARVRMSRVLPLSEVK